MLAVIASDRMQVSADAFASDERERGLAKGPLFLSLSLSLKKKAFSYSPDAAEASIP